eukprot:2540420-Pleurochrysis_carterae.AAC.1
MHKLETAYTCQGETTPLKLIVQYIKNIIGNNMHLCANPKPHSQGDVWTERDAQTCDLLHQKELRALARNATTDAQKANGGNGAHEAPGLPQRYHEASSCAKF